MHIFCFINTFRDDFSCMWTCWITVSCCCSCCWCCVCKYAAPLCMIMHGYIHAVYVHTVSCCCSCWCCLCKYAAPLCTMNYVRVWIHHRITNDRMEKHGKGGWIGHNLRPSTPPDFTSTIICKVAAKQHCQNFVRNTKFWQFFFEFCKISRFRGKFCETRN